MRRKKWICIQPRRSSPNRGAASVGPLPRNSPLGGPRLLWRHGQALDLEDVAGQVAAAGGTALPVVTDVTDRHSVEKLIRRTEDAAKPGTGLDVSPALAAGMAAELASGKLDTLTGRAIRVDRADPDELARSADAIANAGILQIAVQLRRPAGGFNFQVPDL